MSGDAKPERAEKPDASFRADGSGRFLIVIAIGLTIIVAGLYAVRPGEAPYHPDETDAAQSEPTPLPGEGEISRAGLELIDTPTSSPEKERLLSSAKRLQVLAAKPDIDLKPVIRTVLASLGGTPDTVDKVQALLLGAVTMGRSDAYIDALLNSAAARGDFEVPGALVTLSGRLDSPSLLTSVWLASDHYQSAEHRAFSKPQTHALEMSDSLAGLSLDYYGHPMEHDRIAEANEITDRMAEMAVGKAVKIPAF